MSRIKVLKICCASETKMIEKIVRPLPGVTEVRVNVVTKTAYVDHDIALCSTQQISDALNQSKMGASVVGKAWGGAAAAGDGESKTGGGQRRGRGVAKVAAAVTGVKQSRIHIGLICCASEVKMVEKIVLPLPGVKDIKVNILTKTACKDASFSRC
jgi:copper chaperone CopZ